MIPLLVLVSIPPMLWGVESGAPQTTEQVVRGSKNGEFLWKYYPPGALKRGEQGTVGFNVTIEPTGTISGCEVTESSGFKALDNETCDIMGLYARVEPVRGTDGRAIRAVQKGFINWKLPPGTTKIASAPTATRMPKPDKLICRKDITTGSLIATTRQCLTASEWRRQENQTKDEIDHMGMGKGNVDCHSTGAC